MKGRCSRMCHVAARDANLRSSTAVLFFFLTLFPAFIFHFYVGRPFFYVECMPAVLRIKYHDACSEQTRIPMCSSLLRACVSLKFSDGQRTFVSFRALLLGLPIVLSSCASLSLLCITHALPCGRLSCANTRTALVCSKLLINECV